MAFPTTAILDAGTGADANPAGGNWTGGFYADPGSLRRLSAQLKGTNGAGAFNGSYWNPATFSGAVEAFYTLAVLPASGDSIWVNLAMAGGAGPSLNTPDGYGFTYQHGVGARSVGIYKLTGGAQAALTTGTIAAPLSAGDAIGIEDTGSVINGWVRQAGVWSVAVTKAAESTYSGPYNLAVELQNTTVAITNFGGGVTVVAGTKAPPLWTPPGAARRCLLTR